MIYGCLVWLVGSLFQNSNVQYSIPEAYQDSCLVWLVGSPIQNSNIHFQHPIGQFSWFGFPFQNSIFLSKIHKLCLSLVGCVFFSKFHCSIFISRKLSRQLFSLVGWVSHAKFQFSFSAPNQIVLLVWISFPKFNKPFQNSIIYGCLV